MLSAAGPAPSGRLLLIIAVVLFFLALLYSRYAEEIRLPNSIRIRPHVPGESSSDRAPILRPEDHWNPPFKQYTPDAVDFAESQWVNFLSIDDSYALGTNNSDAAQNSHPAKTQSDEQAAKAHAAVSDIHLNRVPCKGPRGNVLGGTNATDQVIQNLVKTHSFAKPLLGAPDVIGFEQDVCFDRHGRWDPYGLKSHDKAETPFDWDSVDWAQLQYQCVNDNIARFDLSSKATLVKTPKQRMNGKKTADSLGPVTRTAVVLRLHEEWLFGPDVRRYMRAVIQELALQTGGEHQVFALVEIKDPNTPIETREQRTAVIERIMPPKFREMTLVWNEKQWVEEYPLIPENQLNVHISTWFCVQYFARQHPEFDYYWNWDMDVRYTSHYAEMVDKLDGWTAAQPRKGLWERNSRFYIPRLHGSWTHFRNVVQQKYFDGDNDSSIWKPQLDALETTAEQKVWLEELKNLRPPVASPAEDNFEWGVGEKADLITFLPQVHPYSTFYVFEDAHWHYIGFKGQESPKHEPNPPRRTNIITFSRLSARLIHLMDLENTVEPGHHMGSESWPQSIALHYGLKSVSVPHGIYMERNWPAQAADWIFNTGDQKEILRGVSQEILDQRGEGAGGPESTYGLGREHNWKGSSWYYQNELARRLYSRWLGNEEGGIGGQVWEAENGLYCLPPMLLHPVKQVSGPDDI